MGSVRRSAGGTLVGAVMIEEGVFEVVEGHGIVFAWEMSEMTVYGKGVIQLTVMAVRVFAWRVLADPLFVCCLLSVGFSIPGGLLGDGLKSFNHCAGGTPFRLLQFWSPLMVLTNMVLSIASASLEITRHTCHPACDIRHTILMHLLSGDTPVGRAFRTFERVSMPSFEA